MAQKGRTDLLFNVLFDAQLLLRLTPCLEVGTQTAPIFNAFPKLLRLTISKAGFFYYQRPLLCRQTVYGQTDLIET